VPRGYLRNDIVSFTVPQEQIDTTANEHFAETGMDHLKGVDVDLLTGFAGSDGQLNEEFIETYLAMLNYSHNIDRADLEETGGYGTTLQLLLQTVTAELDSFPTTHAQDFAELTGPFTDYDRWVALTIRTRFKHVLGKVQENLHFRLQTAPSNSSAWIQEKHNWLMVNDDTEINLAGPTHTVKESLRQVDVHIPSGDLPVFVRPGAMTGLLATGAKIDMAADRVIS